MAEDNLNCPHCGSLEFEICGVVFYRQRYYAESNYYDSSEIFWDADYPEYAECSQCKTDVSLYFKERGVFDSYFEVKPRTLKKTGGDACVVP